MDNDKKFLKQAIRQATLSFKKGGFPAGAVLVKNGKIIARSVSVGNIINDPTAHAETSCIRKACKKLKTTNLEGCVLYASMQPCLMCFSAANWANVSKIVYGTRKNEEMIEWGCYEGANELDVINSKNNNKIELIFIEYSEQGNLLILEKWKQKTFN